MTRHDYHNYIPKIWNESEDAYSSYKLFTLKSELAINKDWYKTWITILNTQEVLKIV